METVHIWHLGYIAEVDKNECKHMINHNVTKVAHTIIYTICIMDVCFGWQGDLYNN